MSDPARSDGVTWTIIAMIATLRAWT